MSLIWICNQELRSRCKNKHVSCLFIFPMPRPFLDHRRSSLHQVVLPAPYKSASQFLGWGRFWFHMSILRFHQFFLARRMLEDLMRPWVGKMAWNCVEPRAACPLNVGCVEALGQIYSDFLFAICRNLKQPLKLAIVGVMPSSGRCEKSLPVILREWLTKSCPGEGFSEAQLSWLGRSTIFTPLWPRATCTRRRKRVTSVVKIQGSR